jgi:carboxymethylenebutenolidase
MEARCCYASTATAHVRALRSKVPSTPQRSRRYVRDTESPCPRPSRSPRPTAPSRPMWRARRRPGPSHRRHPGDLRRQQGDARRLRRPGRPGLRRRLPRPLLAHRTGIDITDQSEAEWKKAFELYNAFDVDAGVSDIAATIAAVRDLPGVNGKVGAVGYCLGGLLAFLTATRTDADASVSYYGVGIEKHVAEAEKAGPAAADAHRRGRPVRAEGSPEGHPRRAEGSPADRIHTYPGRDHAFARVGGAHYDAADAGTANARSLAFFKSNLG